MEGNRRRSLQAFHKSQEESIGHTAFRQMRGEMTRLDDPHGERLQCGAVG